MNDHDQHKAILNTLWAIKGSLDRIAEVLEYQAGKV